MAPVTSRRRPRPTHEEDEPSRPGLGKRQRRHRDIEEDEQSQNGDFTEDPFRTPGPSERGSKERREVDGEEDGEEDEDDDQEEDDSNYPADPFSTPPPGQQQGQQHRPNTFQPGAIVRVTVTNFVTYEHAEFLPGPSLNMVLGPNGTGKSSLVCAVALGLGFPPKVLGRASDVKEFVKHGKDAATIEIELQKNRRDNRNPVVRMQITREDNGRKWWLNGQDTTHKNIQALMKSFRIQVDNLCQFLPQDKVAEFAGLTPVQLLQETLKAAAPEEMGIWQTRLKEYHEDFKSTKQLVDQKAEDLARNENRQQGLQADVDRLHEREAIKQSIVDLEKARACAEYNCARDRHKEASKKKKLATKRLKELENACEPALQAVNRKEEYQSKLEAVLKDRQRKLKTVEAAAAEGLKADENADEKLQALKQRKNAEGESATKIRGEVGAHKRNITKLKAKQSQEPTKFVAQEWNEKIREKSHIIRDNEAARREISSRLTEVNAQGKNVLADLRKIDDEVRHLDSQEGQQLSVLRRLSPDAARGWEWLRDNQDQFEKEIFGPPMLTCSLKDKRYSDLVQSLLGREDFLCFTTQSRSDHKKLSDHFYKNMELSVSIRMCATDFAAFRPPVTTQEARRLGLDGFAVEYLEGPDPVLAMLCSEKKVHAAGVALGEASSDQFDELVNGQKISLWSTGHTNYRVIRRREYGPDASTTTTRKITPGRFWNDQPVDNEERTVLQRNRAEKMDQKAELVKELNELNEKLKELRDSEEETRREQQELTAQKSEVQKAWTEWEVLPNRIEIEESNLEDRRSALMQSKERIADIEAEYDNLVVKKAQLVLAHKNMVFDIRMAHQALLDVEFRLTEAKSDVKGLKDRNVDIIARLQEKKEAIANYAAEAELAREESLKAREKVEAIAAEEGDEEQWHQRLDYYKNLARDKTVEEIDADIDVERAKLELIHGVDPNILAQFEKRAQDIERLIKMKTDLEAKLNSVGEQKAHLMSRWEPRLDELVSKINEAFSYNFEQISCAGEVGVHKDEDFDQWAIEIKVKFRENETLQQLNQHRQSGGERAVSTIFYLMALQSMAQAPFRVVDEINQGMDPRNERIVHERMVEIACREHTSQYFLITPKLLNDLRSDERMRYLVIASGPHMPQQGRKLDFSKLVGIQRRMQAAA